MDLSFHDVEGARHDRASGDPATRAYYEDNAADYAATTWRMDMGPAAADFAARLPRGGSVLDLGSGGGRDLDAFRRFGLVAVGLDLSPALATIARALSGSPTVVADMASPPFADASFDGVWACASLHHLKPAGQAGTLAGIRRVLRRRGLLFTSMKLGLGGAREPCGRAFSYVDADGWTARARAAGFEVLDMVSQTQGRGSGKVAWLASLCRSL